MESSASALWIHLVTSPKDLAKPRARRLLFQHPEVFKQGSKRVKIVGINNVSESDVRQVMKDMERLGPPTIRVLRHAGVLYAIEGTTRLTAAERLNVRPNIVVVANDDTEEPRDPRRLQPR